MKVEKAKEKVAEKVAKGKEKVAAKCGKAAKCAAILFALASVATGCATADAPTAQRAQNVTAKDISIVFNFSGTNGVPPTISVEIATAAQANETSGTETMTSTPTQTPTTDVKPQTDLTYGLASGTAAGAKWIDALDEGCAKCLAAWLGTGRANGTMTVTKKDGTTETVTCKDGKCTTASGECITCGACSDCEDTD